jgi:hypothetical protein
MKKKLSLFLLPFVALASLYGWSLRNDGVKKADRILAGAYDVKDSITGDTSSLSYFISLPHPAHEALALYGRYYRSKGWVPMDSWKGLGEQKKWSSRQMLVGEQRNECIYEYNTAWSNEKKDRMASLILNYYERNRGGDCPPAPRSQELLVTLQEMPVKVP